MEATDVGGYCGLERTLEFDVSESSTNQNRAMIRRFHQVLEEGLIVAS
jgi:hypothetical protein